MNTKKYVVSNCKMSESVVFCIRSTLSETEVICEEKKLAEIFGKTRVLMFVRGFVLFVEHQGAAQRRCLAPSEVPPYKCTSASAPFLCRICIII